MGLFKKNKYNTSVLRETNFRERDAEIEKYELMREYIDREIEDILVEYKRLTGNRNAVKGKKAIGKSKKDYSYWHKNY